MQSVTSRDFELVSPCPFPTTITITSRYSILSRTVASLQFCVKPRTHSFLRRLRFYPFVGYSQYILGPTNRAKKIVKQNGKYIYIYIYIYIWRSLRCNGYQHRKWTQQHKFKSQTRLIVFHITLIPMGKV